MFPKEEIPEESGFRNFLKRTLTYENLGKSLLPYSTVDAREKRQPGYKPETELPDIPSPLDVAGKGLGLGIQGIGALRKNARENPLPEFLPDIPTPLGVLRKGVGTGLSQIGEVIKATPDPVKQKARDIAPSSEIIVPILESILDPGNLGFNYNWADPMREWVNSRQENKEQRQEHMDAVSKLIDNSANLLSIPNTGEIAGKTYKKYIKQEEINGSIFSESDKSYIEPIIPEEFTQYVTKEYGEEAGFLAESVRQVSTPLDLHITAASMIAYGGPKPGSSEAIKQAVRNSWGTAAKQQAGRKATQASGGKVLNPYNPAMSRKLNKQYNNQVPSRTGQVINTVGNVLKPLGYHTPGLKGMLMRGGAEIALGTTFVSGLRGIDAGIEKFNPELKEKNPILTAFLSFVGAFGATAGGVIGGQVVFGAGKTGLKQISKQIPGTKSNIEKKELQKLNERIKQLFDNPVTGGADGDVLPKIDPFDIVVKEIMKSHKDLAFDSPKDAEKILNILRKYDVENPRNSLESYTEQLFDENGANIYETLKNEITDNDAFKILTANDQRLTLELLEEYKTRIQLVQNTYYEALESSKEFTKTMLDFVADGENRVKPAKNPYQGQEKQFSGQPIPVLEGSKSITTKGLVDSILELYPTQIKETMERLNAKGKEKYRFHQTGKLVQALVTRFIEQYNAGTNFGNRNAPPIKLEWKGSVPDAKTLFGNRFVSRTDNLNHRHIITPLMKSKIQILGGVTQNLEQQLATNQFKYGFVELKQDQWKALIRDLRGVLLDVYDPDKPLVKNIVDEYTKKQYKTIADLAIDATQSNEGYKQLTQNLLNDPDYYKGNLSSDGTNKNTLEGLEKNQNTKPDPVEKKEVSFFNIANETFKSNYINSYNNVLAANKIKINDLTKNSTDEEWADFLEIPKITGKSGKKKTASTLIRNEMANNLKKILVTGTNIDGRALSEWQLEQLENLKTNNLPKYRKLSGNLQVIKQYKDTINRMQQNSKVIRHANWKRGLFNEAQKYETFEEFSTEYFKNQKNGRYYHVTKDENFWINPDKSTAGAGKGNLVFTSDLLNWSQLYADKKLNVKVPLETPRDYVAILDLSRVNPEDYKQLTRGLGNEFFLSNVNKAKVLKVLPIDVALKDYQRFADDLSFNITSKKDLEKFYNDANQKIDELKEAEKKARDIQAKIDEPPKPKPLSMQTVLDAGFTGKPAKVDPSKLQGTADPEQPLSIENLATVEDQGPYKLLKGQDNYDGNPRTQSDTFIDATGRTKTDIETTEYNNAGRAIDSGSLTYETNTDLDEYWRNLAVPQRAAVAALVQNRLGKEITKPLKFISPNLWREEEEIGILRAKFEMWKQKEMSLADVYVDSAMYTLQKHFKFNIKNGGIDRKNYKSKKYKSFFKGNFEQLDVTGEKTPAGAKVEKILLGGFGEELDGKALEIEIADNIVLKNEKGKVIADYSTEKRQLENVDMDDYERLLIREKWLQDNNAYGSKTIRSIHDIVNSLDPKHPSYKRYNLTQDQKAILESIYDHQTAQYRKIQVLFDDVTKNDPKGRAKILAEERGYYFHRIVKKTPNGKDNTFTEKIKKFLGVTEVAKGVGGKTDFTKQRLFDDLDILFDEGYTVEMNPKIALQTRLHQGIDLIGRTLVQSRLENLARLKRRSQIYAESDLGISAKQDVENAKRTFEKLKDDYKKIEKRRKQLEKNKTAPAKAVKELLALKAREQTLFPMLQVSKARFEQAKAAEKGYRNLGMRKRYEEKTILGKPIPKELEEVVKKNFDDMFVYSRNQKTLTSTGLDLIQGFRAFLTTGELSVMGIQLNKLIFSDPIMAGKVVYNGMIKHVTDPYAYVEKNYDAIVSGTKWGAINLPSEFMYTGGLSKFPTEIPVAGAYLDQTNQFFEKAIFVAQTELWKAATEVKKISDLQIKLRRAGSFLPFVKDASLLQRMGISDRASITGDLNALKVEGIDVEQFRIDLANVGSAIRRDVGTENYNQIGVWGKQAIAEQLGLFASRFFRALSSQFYAMAQPGEQGRYARRAMASFLIGSTAFGTAINMSVKGKPMNMTNPEASDWMHVYLPDGTIFPIYGPQHQYLRAMAKSGKFSLEGDASRAAREWTNLVANKKGLAVSGTFGIAELITKGEIETFDGEIIDASANGFYVFTKERVPIIAQEIGESIFTQEDPYKTELGIQQDGPRFFAIIEFFGFNAKDSDTLNIQRNRVAKELYNKTYNQLQDENLLVEIAKVNNDPAVELNNLESAMRFGGYRKEDAILQAETYYKQIQLLNQLFFDKNGKALPVTSQSIRDFRSKAQALDGSHRDQREKIKEILGQDFEEQVRSDPKSNFEAALFDYFDVIDNSIRNTLFDGQLFKELITEQEKKWTKEQNKYIQEYRARKQYPPGFEYLRDFNNKLSGPEYKEAIKAARVTAQNGTVKDKNNKPLLNLAKLYIWKKYVSKDPTDGLLDIKETPAGLSPVATPVPQLPSTYESFGLESPVR